MTVYAATKMPLYCIEARPRDEMHRGITVRVCDIHITQSWHCSGPDRPVQYCVRRSAAVLGCQPHHWTPAMMPVAVAMGTTQRTGHILILVVLARLGLAA